MLLSRKQNTVELRIATPGKSQFSKPSKYYSRYSGGFFSCVIDATNTRLMMIIKSELDHYYLANKNIFSSLFLFRIETLKKGYEGKLCLKHLCFFRRWHFFYISLPYQFNFHFLFNFYIQTLEKLWKNKPQTSVLTTFLSSPKGWFSLATESESES